MQDRKLRSSAFGLSRRQEILKRTVDLSLAVPGFFITLPIVFVAVIVATIDTRDWGIFSQERIGRGATKFKVHKIRSMRSSSPNGTTVTTSCDPRITRSGALMRRTKLDELPQLWDVIVGNMSLVGPRPDVSGWADKLEGADEVILSVRPGITGPASIAYRDEEETLANANDPEKYNREVIWPSKVEINKHYILEWKLADDLKCLMQSVGLWLPRGMQHK